MPHTLIIGTSGSGKTPLAKKLAEARRGQAKTIPNFRQVALDPMGSKWPDGVYVVDNWEDFETELEIMHEAGEVGCLYVDEADKNFSHSQKEKMWLATRGKHFGLDLTYITQFPTMIAPAVRGQCEKLHVFKIGLQAARLLAEDYAAPGLLQAPNLKRGEWLCVEWGATGEREVNKYVLFTPESEAAYRKGLTNQK